MFNWQLLVQAARIPSKRRFQRVFAFDTEYDADTRDLVCGQWITLDLRSGEVGTPRLCHVDDPELGETLRQAFMDPETLIVGQNVGTDMLVVGECLGLDREVVNAYSNRRVGDTRLRELLTDYARPAREGWVPNPPLDPEDEAGAQGRGYRVWRHKRWSVGANDWDPYDKSCTSVATGLPNALRKASMAAILWRRFGLDITADKGADSWRMRYGELRHVPISEWPVDAILYAINDAPNTLAPWLSQAAPPDHGDWDRADLKWWESLTDTPDGALGLSHEFERAEFAYILMDIEYGPGFTLDQEYTATLREKYKALRDDSKAFLGTLHRYVSESGEAAWMPHEAAAEAVIGPAQEDPQYPSMFGKKGAISQKPLKEEAHRIYMPSDVPPALTTTGMQKAGEYETKPLREWHPAALAYISTSGKSVKYVLDPRTPDAKKLVEDPINGLEWNYCRLDTALSSVSAPAILAKNVASKAHAILGMIDRFEGDAAHPSYNPLLRTGRVSAFGALPQNLPQMGGVRECFVPRPGYALAVSDFNQIEMVAFSWLRDRFEEIERELPTGSVEGPLTQAINSGQDAHILLALEILRRPEGYGHDEAKALRKAVENAISEHDGDTAAARSAHPDLDWDFALNHLFPARKTAKGGNFGFLGGLGAKGFVRMQARAGNVFSMDEAMEVRRAWSETWQVDPYFRFISKLDKKGVFLKSGILLRVPGSRLVLGGSTYTQAANVLFQGLCARLLAQSTNRVWRSCKGLEGDTPLSSGGHIMHLIHDEIVVEVPTAQAEEGLAELQDHMKGAARDLLPGMAVSVSGEILHRWRKC